MKTSICIHNDKTPAVRFIDGKGYLAFEIKSRDDEYSDINFFLKPEHLKDFQAELVAAAKAVGECVEIQEA